MAIVTGWFSVKIASAAKRSLLKMTVFRSTFGAINASNISVLLEDYDLNKRFSRTNAG